MAKRQKNNDPLQHTEMTFSSNIKEWVNLIIQKEQLPFGRAEVEIKEAGKPQRADITLYSSPTSMQAICIIECKQPYENVFSNPVIEQAASYAQSFPAPYFATCNGRTLAWFDAHEYNESNITTTGCLKSFSLSSTLQRFSSSMLHKERLDIQAGLRLFLIQLNEHHYKKKHVPLTEINEFFVLRLQTTTEQLFGYYRSLVEQRLAKDKKFDERIHEWFLAQGWSFTFQPLEYELVARQASYLLVNKIILYAALQQKWGSLDKLSVNADIKRGGKLKQILELYFNDVLKVDYQTIFSADNLDIGFPEAEHAVDIVRILIDDLNRYNLAELGYEIIGALFERLIPRVERHKLGQYFTPAEVVDLMLMFCSYHATDTILDPATGAGTFLVRAYQYKVLEQYQSTHEDILQLLWGCDIDPFPAHLAAINLAIRGLDSHSNFPRILHRDFFKTTPETLSFPIPVVDELETNLWSTGTPVHHLDQHPDLFDVVIGNPPYTRQEYLGDFMPSDTYKEDLIQQVFLLPDGTKLPPFSKRAGLHAYFFVHGYKFLKEGGRLAFVTSNSWLNAQYGSSLQAFLLAHFKILAILESDKESWFPSVNVDNCIIVLEKCSGIERSSERNANLVHFVRFHVSLVPTIVHPGDDDTSQRKRFHTLKRLVDLILAQDMPVSREDFHIYPKKQKELLDEGTDHTKNQYIGSRWGKFTTAPDVWYKLVDPSQKMVVPLSELADFHYGLKTGANEFFYVKDDDIQKYGIEPEFWGSTINGTFLPNIVMKSPQESKTVSLDLSSLKLRALSFHAPPETLLNTHAWSYILMGENMAWHERPTCMARHRRHAGFGWYDLGDVLPRSTILWPELSGMRRKNKVFISDIPVIANQKLYALSPCDPSLQTLLVAVLNSTLLDFLSEFESTSYAGWVGVPGDLSLNAAKHLLIPDIRQFTVDQKLRMEDAFSHYKIRPIGTLAQEFGVKGTAAPSLDSIASDLRIMDSIVMGEILGLSEQEQLSIYQTLFTLSSRRIEKVQHAAKKQPNKVKREFDEDIFISAVMDQAEDEMKEVNRLYRKMIWERDVIELEVLPQDAPPFRGKPFLKTNLWEHQLILGPQSISYPLSQHGEALYRQAWAIVRVPYVKMPLQIETLLPETQALLEAIEQLDETVNIFTNKVLDTRMRKQSSSRIWSMIKQQILDLSSTTSPGSLRNAEKRSGRLKPSV